MNEGDYMNSIETRKERAFQLYMNGMSIAKASSSAGIDERTLSRLLRKRDIDTSRNSRKYVYNEDYFETIDTEEKAYWLGFIYADGCIRENQGKEKSKGLGLEISLKEIDKSHLEKFIKSIGCNDESIIKKKIVKLKEKEYISYRVVINSTKMCRDLISKGVTPRKSLTLKFPTKNIVSDELLRHFIRGYSDGDGNIGVRNTKRYVNCPRVTILGTEDFLAVLKTVLNKRLNITDVKLYLKQNSKAYYYQKTGDDAREILRYMYDGASIYLDRKYEDFKQIFAV